MKKFAVLLSCIVAVLATPAMAQAMPDIDNTTWFATGKTDADARVKLYFFWSKTCPHCHEAKPFIEGMAQEFPWLELESYEISDSRQNAGLYGMMARMMGEEAQYVPAFFYCGVTEHGYDKAETSGKPLRQSLIACHDRLLKALAAKPAEKLQETQAGASAPEAAAATPAVLPAAAPVPAPEKQAVPAPSAAPAPAPAMSMASRSSPKLPELPYMRDCTGSPPGASSSGPSSVAVSTRSGAGVVGVSRLR